jgi:hypothetical protein
MSGLLGSAQWMYASGAAVTQQSLKFNDDESQDLTFTPSSDTSGSKKGTFACWMKIASNSGTNGGTFIGAADTNHYGQFYSNTLYFGTSSSYMNTAAVFRDYSAWMHVLFVFDTTLAASADRMQIWVNGVRQSVGTFNVQPSQNSSFAFLNTTQKYYLGSRGSNYFDGYLSDVYFIDGQALDPTSFGQFTNGYWEAIDYAGTYGTNGFHLTFADDVVSEGFNAVTYRGTGANQSISGLGFEPDFVWIKVRNNPNNHRLFDSVRGASSDLISNSSGAESITSTRLVSFDTDGFTVGSNAEVNGNGYSHVGWAWDAGSGSPVSNTDGSITSTVKANPSYGFSVVSWSGSSAVGTIGHGLSAVPELIITKRRDFTTAWHVYSQTLGNTNGLYLHDTAASTAFGPTWNSTSPTSSVFSVGDGNWINQGSMIAYCFHSVANYSSIGSFSGSGATGNAVTTGFAPAFVMLKRTDSTSDWTLFDNTRDPYYDGTNNRLWANLSDAESTTANYIEFTSTGFTLKAGDGAINASGGTYIYMAFADTREAAFWKDVSGQGNHWTPSGLDYRDSLIDSPANNFATFNPIDKNDGTYSEGNLKAVTGTVGGSTQRGSFYFNNGKWYYEFLPTINGGITALGFESLNGGVYTPHFYQADNGQYYNGASASAYGATFTTLDVIGVALDADNQTVEFFKNGASQGLISSVNSGMTAGDEYVVHLTDRDVAQTLTGVINFGQDSTFSGARPAGGNVDDNGIGDFAYPVPSGGYLALCSANLPTPSIVDGSEHFNTVLYTGTGSSNSIITGFQPDFTWIKSRSNSYDHQLVNSVVGYPNGTLLSNATDAEYTASPRVDSRDSNGFTVSTPAQVNLSSGTFASWNWKAGGTPTATNTAGVGAVPTSGSVMIDGVASTSSLAGTIAANKISANTAAGFSIINYTGNGLSGQTVAHALSSTPEFLIMKDRGTNSNNGQWQAWHKSAGDGDDYGYLSTTNAFTGDAQIIPNGTDTIELKVNLTTSNQSGHSFIMYAFHSVEGYCKAGRYIGNGSTDGPYIHLGFRASWIMVKSTGASNWFIWDTSRNPYNATTTPLFPNSSSAEEATLYPIDILSNGFKLRGASGLGINESATYIYLAFAENPFKYANAR